MEQKVLEAYRYYKQGNNLLKVAEEYPELGSAHTVWVRFRKKGLKLRGRHERVAKHLVDTRKQSMLEQYYKIYNREAKKLEQTIAIEEKKDE